MNENGGLDSKGQRRFRRDFWLRTDGTEHSDHLDLWLGMLFVVAILVFSASLYYGPGAVVMQ
jgi:hypothetical protein